MADQIAETSVVAGTALTFVLVTPARNEGSLIEATIRAVLVQTRQPLRWVIVSDGSTDNTDEIVSGYAASYPWIELVKTPERKERHFAGKARCFNVGFERLRPLTFDVIGNLDADITFEQDYFEFLLGKFAGDSSLGVAGTPFVEDHDRPGQHTYAHRFAQLEHVSGACQLFRRKCFEEVGGYIPVKGGAIDWIAVTTARMRGWKTRTFPEKVCFHHRMLGTGDSSPLMVRMRYAEKAYYVGGHPLWEILRGFFQMRERPRVLGGLFFLAGYFLAAIKRIPRVVSPELITFHREEQMTRLRQSFGRFFKVAGNKGASTATETFSGKAVK